MLRYVVLFHFLCSLCCASATVVLENVCTTLDIVYDVAKSAPTPIAFPYLQVPAAAKFIVPSSSLPQIVGDVVPQVGDQVNVPNLQQRKGVWPKGVVNVVNPHTGKAITFHEIQSGPDGTNCGWHALKNALCLLNVRFRPDHEKIGYVNAMQSPVAFIDLLKPWLELVLPFRRTVAPDEYASNPLGNWPGEAEMDIALGRTNGVRGYDEEFAAVDKALKKYQWAPGVDLRNYISFISLFDSSFANPKTTREEHLAVLKKICLQSDADHAFVINTSANAKMGVGVGFHWVQFFLHKKDGVITWLSCDSLGAGTYHDLKKTLNKIFTQSPEELRSFEEQVLYHEMGQASQRVMQIVEQLDPQYNYVCKGVLVKKAAIGADNFLDKQDLVNLKFADSVEKITDAMVQEQINAIHASLMDRDWFLAEQEMVFASFYNAQADHWLIMRQRQNKPVPMKLSDFPVSYGKSSQAPTRRQIAQRVVDELPADKQSSALFQYLQRPKEVDVPADVYWWLFYSNWKLAMFPDPENGKIIERFYLPESVVVDFMQKVWSDGYNPLEVKGNQILLKDKQVWPEFVRKNMLKATISLIDVVLAHPELFPLTKEIEIVNIPDTRAVPEVDQHVPPLFGDVKHELKWWLIETLKKTMPLKSAEKPEFEAMVAKVRAVNSDFADQVAALAADAA